MLNYQRVYIYIYIWLVVSTNPSEKYESNGMILPNWMEIHKIPWFQSPPTSSNQCRSRASLSDLSGLNSQRVIPPFTGEVKTYLSEKKTFAPTKTPLGFWFFPAEIPTLDSLLLSLHELQFINENLQSPCLAQKKSPTITKSCCWHHLFQVITIEIPTSPFLMGKILSPLKSQWKPINFD